ncbi:MULTISPECIES: NAD(+) diphosphatase [unclassified Yoonia]|uniref:NAD(+) diphosphatase n=1 Tax=unclassified Yoonia TaxID=2629118 RepID=UPI002AFE683A|nr:MULTISPECIES: NAD(+) diphosphatase [unclassified Yoonia]
MMFSETVTFGGSALDRAAALRADPAAAMALPGAQTVLLWRGKPMVMDDALIRVPLDHPVMADTSPDLILLGRDDTGPVFAADLSGWTPPDLDITHLDTFLDPSEQKHPAMPKAASFAELRAIMTRLTSRDAELAATAKAVIGWHDSHRFCARCGTQSVAAMAGWQRNCPACGAHHFPRTDPVVIMLITHGNNVLVGRSPGWPEGMYSLLAGFVEPGETIEAAVRREVWEEAGIAVGDVRYLASQPWPFPASLMFGCAGDALGVDLTIDQTEIEDARWVSREDMALSFAGLHPGIKPARKGAIAHFLIENWLADRNGRGVA